MDDAKRTYAVIPELASAPAAPGGSTKPHVRSEVSGQFEKEAAE